MTRQFALLAVLCVLSAFMAGCESYVSNIDTCNQPSFDFRESASRPNALSNASPSTEGEQGNAEGSAVRKNGEDEDGENMLSLPAGFRVLFVHHKLTKAQEKKIDDGSIFGNYRGLLRARELDIEQQIEQFTKQPDIAVIRIDYETFQDFHRDGTPKTEKYISGATVYYREAGKGAAE